MSLAKGTHIINTFVLNAHKIVHRNHVSIKILFAEHMQKAIQYYQLCITMQTHSQTLSFSVSLK